MTDKTIEPESTADDAGKFETAEGMADAEHATGPMANQQAEIEAPKGEAQSIAEDIGGDDAQAVKAGGPLQQLPATGLEKASETNEEPSDKRQVTLLEKLVALSEEQGTLQKKQLRLAIIAIFLAVVAIIIAVIIGWDKISSLQTDVKLSQFVITSPSENEGVGLGQKVYGKTQFFEMNHYVVVTVVRTRTAYVQNEPAFVSPDGSFSGEARFGDQSVGLDDEFRIQVLATKTTLSPGILSNVPPDAKFSKSVTVRRVEPSGNQIVITSPIDGAEVAFDDKILGKTPLPEMNHYIVVTPVRIGTAFVQDNAASVNGVDGTFSGTARFGGAEVGVGEQFIVRVVATRSILPAGPLIHEPDDAVASNSVTVRRKK